MISTLLNYRLYTNDLAKTLSRVSQQATIERDGEYYKTNIGKVTSVDEFLGDYKLYAYAMKAYGLEDQIASKGLMRKVLESDLSDANSFANKLVDKRYQEFAGAFNFVSAAEPAIQSASQTDLLTEAYSEQRVRAAANAARTVGTYNSRIAEVRSVDDLLADPALFKVVATVAGFNPENVSRAYLREALVGTVTTTNFALNGLKARFQFAADGSLPAGTPAQTHLAAASISSAYFDATGTGKSAQGASYKASYFEAAIQGVTSVSALVGDQQLFNYVLTAFGFDPSVETASFVGNILMSDPSDPSSTLSNMPEASEANRTRKARFTALNAAFGFDGTGKITGGSGPLTQADGAASITDGYYANYQKGLSNDDKLRTNSFLVQLSNMKSINDLLGRDPVYGKKAFEYVMKAFDLDPAAESTAKIRKVLQSDPSDPNSYVSKLGDERYEKLAAAFNFGPDGKATAQRLAQSTTAQTRTGSLYAASFGTDLGEAKKAVIAADTKAYLKGMADVRSLDGFLGDDKLVAYALKAYGLEDEKLSNADLKKLFTSDLGDAQSFANAKGDKRFVDLVAAFNFTTAGLVSRDGAGIQSGGKVLSTQNQYVLQMLEAQAGETSEGTRLALYFLRKAPDIKGPYNLLADKALLEVARTALGLPSGMSGMEVEAQAKILEKRIDFADFQNPKKLDAFIARFSSMYDLNSSGTSSNPVLNLFGGGGSTTDILAYL